jgi:hypothetical protein
MKREFYKRVKDNCMIPIPDYLKQYALNPLQKGNHLSFDVNCTCGGNLFHIFKKTIENNEKKLIEQYEKSSPHTGVHSIYCGVDSHGNIYHYIKILGIFKKKIQFPTPPIVYTINVIKAVCSKCQNEIVLFDDRCYGYDGMNSDNEDAKNYKLDLKARDHKVYSLEVIIENELSLREFNEATGENVSLEHYSNSFSRICIKGTDDIGKKTLLYDFETV